MQHLARIPTKTLVRRAGAFGVETGGTAVAMDRVAARTAEVVSGMVAANARAFAASGFDIRRVERIGLSHTRITGQSIFMTCTQDDRQP